MPRLPGPGVCDVGERGLLLPIGGDAEQRWPTGLRIVLYFTGLCWSFTGVALVADIFMGAIERITSKKTRKLNPHTGHIVTVTVWNETVANLTLMALGSSAPEILLSVVELFGNNLYSGALGPSTIVGSAAFNLFCITAVCVVAIPDGEIRFIKEFQVYLITAVFSIVAYLWLLVILIVNSKNVVEVWEGAFTFMMFPILVVLSYCTDKGYFSKDPPTAITGWVVSEDMSAEELAELEAHVRQKHGSNLTDEQVLKIIKVEHTLAPSRAAKRVAATRKILGGKKVVLRQQTKTRFDKVVPVEDAADGVLPVTIEIQNSSYAVLENAGHIDIPVIRSGNTTEEACVSYKTVDGTAKAGSDYKPLQGQLHFAADETSKIITIPLIDDEACEDDEDFQLVLYEPSRSPRGVPVLLGGNEATTITIIDDDLVGVLLFENESATVKESREDKFFNVRVLRRRGSTGTAGCKFTTEDDSARAGVDYLPNSGDLEFFTAQTSASIRVLIKAAGRYERTGKFRIVLSEPYGGIKFAAETDGGEEQGILTVFIEASEDTKARIDKMKSTLNVNWERAKIGNARWEDQFRHALRVRGEDDDDDEDDNLQGLVLRWSIHIITMPWKLLFALIPPADYADGWVCFCCSLLMIGGVTALIGDLAALLGCVLTIPDEITAITFVALGTSLPDTFASKTAATQDPFADASICNITGSNSVNVFLGLGLPWMMGAVYWTYAGANDEWTGKYAIDRETGKPNEWLADFKSGAFVVESGALAFSVGVFSSFALCTIVTLYIRRVVLGGELGGPRPAKYASSGLFVTFWLLYLALSSWNVLDE